MQKQMVFYFTQSLLKGRIGFKDKTDLSYLEFKTGVSTPVFYVCWQMFNVQSVVWSIAFNKNHYYTEFVNWSKADPCRLKLETSCRKNFEINVSKGRQ